ncbi:MAG TPA: hypothetical protein VMF32_18355 [Xanthobacteraceae bacterium]|nr:hypothetical protein [Xanthobacteraceae bacterium]
MAAKILKSAALLAGAFIATEASAHAPAPLIPTALVEDVKSASADVEFMDYVGAGQVIKLRPGDVLVLSYLKSCEHETITGGTVTVGNDHSEVDGGKVARTKVACDGGKVELPGRQASETAATAFRLQSAEHEPTLFALSAMIEIPKLHPGESHELIIERVDRPGERIVVKIDDRLADGGFYDMAKSNKRLTPGATYTASIGDHKITFKVDASAKSGRTSVVSRLLRFQAS